MPKQKTHRGAAKRFSLTKTGKVKHKKMNANHILNKKTSKRKRNLRKATIATSANEATLRTMMPYK